MNIANRAKAIQLVLSDVDGVLTDGGIVFDNQGIEIKRFHIRDGMGIRLWQRAGHRFGLLTSRTSHVVQVRAAELGIDLVRQGFQEKLPVVMALMRELNLTPQQVCYIGDDLPDLPVLRHVGLGVAVADAAAELLSAAHHTTTARGGQGAVRELIEMLLKAQGRYDDLIAKYSGG